MEYFQHKSVRHVMPPSIYSGKGFSLLEMVVVLSVIGVLFALAANRYQSHVTNSQERVVKFQASAFVRTTENIRAISVMQKGNVVDLGDGLLVYLNKHGWPIATNVSGLSPQRNASAEGCRSLWHGLFKEVTEESDNDRTIGSEKFDFSLIENDICRYKLSRKQEGSIFFDYDVITGNVVITSRE